MFDPSSRHASQGTAAPPDDAELLRRYSAEKSQPAFAGLVARHVDLVYSAALRRVGGDAHAAADVTQQVFTRLARQAAALAREHVVLSAWLYAMTRNVAVDFVRTETRRRAREREAHTMTELSSDPTPAGGSEQLRPLLDAAMDELSGRDREAVLLRFFARRAFAEIGVELRVSEDAARMRVERALDKLRARLERRGITSTGAALSLALSSQAVTAAPVGLAASVAGASLAGVTWGAGAGATTALGTLFVMSKIKTGLVIAIVAAIAVPAVVELRANRALVAELGTLRASPADARALQQESERLTTALAMSAGANPEVDELMRLRRRVAKLEARPPGIVDADLKPAKMWRNVGRATAEAANETFHWALFTGDIATVTSLITFRDDTPENRAAFMAKFSPAVRARYPTPELVVAAAFFGAGAGLPNHHHPDDAFQVIAVRPDDRPGMTDVRIWNSLASGREWRGGGRWLATPTGFVLDPLSLTKDIDAAVARFDPATGDLRPRPPLEIDPRTGRPISAKK